MKNSLYILTTLLVLPLLLVGCNTTGCMDNRSSLLLAGFYSAETEKAVALRDIEMGGVGAPNDSLLIDSNAGASEVYLPLRHTYDSTSFFIRYLDKDFDLSYLYDTITINYSSKPYFASEECGAIYFYTIKSLDYTRHMVDSIGLLDSIVNNANLQRMKIYFRTE